MGHQVTFKVDAYPKEVYKGRVSQIRMNPTTVQSVVTYDTIIEFANPELKLFPGMTAYVTIPVATAHNVLKLPNTALRYKPALSSDEVLALYKGHGIEGVQDVPSPATETAAPETALGQNIPRQPKAETAVVWKLHADKTMEPVKVSLGITDHAHTEISAVLNGELKESDDVVIRSVMPKAQALGGVGR
jgi:HlyD family secretion protein